MASAAVALADTGIAPCTAGIDEECLGGTWKSCNIGYFFYDVVQ
jgi:hypothetical protein